MKTKKEFYQVKIKYFYEDYNAMRGFETNNFEDAKNRYKAMQSLLNKNEGFATEWILQLNKIYKNNVVPVMVASSSGVSAESPLV